MKITVVGTGYVGLVTGTCLADAGHEVICVDVDEKKVERMRDGHIPIYEPGLEQLFTDSITAQKLQFTTVLTDGLVDAEAIFLALPTPPNEDGSADLSYILGVAEQLGKSLKSYAVIIDKSTVPVGTTEKVRQMIGHHAITEFDVVSNPEFLREGQAVHDFQNPDRIVIGSSSERAREVMTRVYAEYAKKGSTMIYMDERSAEMTKYAANAFLATKISFMNQVANLCEATGANIDYIREGMGSDPRIGNRFLFAGIGYGGSCFPKDVSALQQTADEFGSPLRLLRAVTEANELQKRRLPEKIMRHYGGNVEGRHFALWGLAFKPDTDDIREAPALELIDLLLQAGATICAYDAEALQNVAVRYAGKSTITFVEDKFAALEKADALIVATEWPEFADADLADIGRLLNEKVIFDGRNMFALDAVRKAGFYYNSIGRPEVNGGNNE